MVSDPYLAGKRDIITDISASTDAYLGDNESVLPYFYVMCYL